MKLNRTEWLAIAITAVFLLLVLGVRLADGGKTAPVTVQTARHTEETATAEKTAAASDGGAKEQPVNLNTASEEELQTLTGIGPKLAERIVAYREENGPFARTEDITLVQGIAGKVYSENAANMTVN